MFSHSHHKGSQCYQSFFYFLLLLLTEDSNDITHDCYLFFLSPSKNLHPGFSFQNRAHCRRCHTMKSFSANLIQSRNCFKNFPIHISAFISFCSLSEVFILFHSQCLLTYLYSPSALRSCIHFLVLFPFAYCKMASPFNLKLFKITITYEMLPE